MQNFENLYQLSKTLRFELKPVGRDGNPLAAKDAAKLFANILVKDKEIKEAYTALKPVMDKIHEDVINNSLTSDEAKAIDFTDYFDKYKKKTVKDDDDKKLREAIGSTFEKTANELANNAGNDEKGKPIFKKKKDKDVGVEYLTQAGVLKYIENNTTDFVFEKLTKQDLIGHLVTFKGFFTYFSGYNKNRENYYETKEEKSTAVATRIVHDNLPKFCDNCVQFSQNKTVKDKNTNQEKTIPCRKDEYLNAYQFLKDANRTVQIKEAETNSMIEAYPIEEKMFEITKFSECLSQSGIETYNRIIGHYNLLINLYNQARKEEKDFKKLLQFKTLSKQIGCGEKKTWLNALKYDTKKEQQTLNEGTSEILNLEETILKISEVGKTYFDGTAKTEDTLTVHNFIDWLKEVKDWTGIYWSKAAVDKVSDKYFANWHEIKDRIQTVLQGKDKGAKDALKSVATFVKKREEQLKINDAVELSGLFEVLNQDNEEGWSQTLFKQSILDDKQSMIDENLSPGQNLINLICADIVDLAKDFCDKSAKILKITDYKNEDNKLVIKHWLDTAKSLIWLIKYFEVKESKVKGNAINSELSNMLSALLYADDAKWFDWYDAVRNYLTKKPQDDAKANKLKLNFEKGNLLGGFVDSHTDADSRDNATQYGGYIFRKRARFQENNDFEYFIGISKNANLFRCHLKNLVRPDDKSNFERLEYYQAKSTTYFDAKYSENKVKLIEIIETLIDECAKENDKLKAVADEIKKWNSNDEITPFKLFDRIKKNRYFLQILNNNTLLDLVNKTIQDLKISCNNFMERAPRLQEIQQKEYHDIEGYEQIVEDLQDVARKNKVFKFFNVSKKELDSTYDDKSNSLYLFKISNKDLSYSETSQKDEKGQQKRNFKGTENLHTQFFRALMREYGECSNIDLGAGAIFFREPASEIKKITHKIGEKMVNRREKGTGDTIPYKVHDELFLFANERKKEQDLSNESKKYLDKNGKIDETRVTVKNVKHEIIKDKRFTEAKFQLHLSIILNFNPKKEDVNETVNDTFTKSDDIQFLGIDRGEKHLVYYSLIDAKGNILQQDHFDVINKKDYLKEINEAAKKRRDKQENWQQKGNISNLKDGYISLVVHEIIQKMKGDSKKFKPTFIVLEDLNAGFKRSRQKFEQQVYQKFELALAKKLNYLVDKNVQDGEGSVANALQLTPPVKTYKDDIEHKKQVGIMLYTRANYTSVTDPDTGWRKTIYLKKGKDKDIEEQIKTAFSEIGMDEQGDYYFQYFDKNTEKVWTLWSSKNGKSLERYRFKRGNSKNESIVEPYVAKEMLDKLFVNFDKEKSLLEQIKNGDKELSKIDDRTAWESLRFVIDIIQQIRNSGDANKNQDDNFLLSPVRNERGEHFDSRPYQKQENPKLPKDADANGAYNIARKGLVMYEHIKQWGKDGKQKYEKTTDLDLFISDKEWDLWLSDENKWKTQLQVFASRKAKDDKKSN